MAYRNGAVTSVDQRQADLTPCLDPSGSPPVNRLLRRASSSDSNAHTDRETRNDQPSQSPDDHRGGDNDIRPERSHAFSLRVCHSDSPGTTWPTTVWT